MRYALLTLLLLLVPVGAAHADTRAGGGYAIHLSQHQPAKKPGITAAGGGRVPCATLVSCHRALDWARRDRQHLRRLLAVRVNRDASYAIRLASAAFGIPERDMRTIASCESGLGAQTVAEAGSGASGLFQFLPSTWARTPFASFDVFDDQANALAAGWLVTRDGNWREWSCSSITGVR